MTESDVGPVLSALSGLLAAYGFYYNAVKDYFTEMSTPKAEILVADSVRRGRMFRALEPARRSSWILALTATVVTVLFLQPAIDILTDVNFDRPYSAVKAGLVVIEAFWSLLAVAMWLRLGRVRSRLETLSQLSDRAPGRPLFGPPEA